MRTIPLSHGLVTLVDDEDYAELSKYNWVAKDGGHDGRLAYYATRRFTDSGGKRHRLYMARVIMDAPSSMLVDHINGDTLDNRRANLRICDHTESNSNRRKHCSSSSTYKGVSWRKDRQKWVERIQYRRISRFLGWYRSEHDAARAYNEAAREMQGEFACVNTNIG